MPEFCFFNAEFDLFLNVAIEITRFKLYNEDMAKTLIFGGAFDPPHIEHVAMCRAAMKELDIDRLVIVPTYLPPHKSAGMLSVETRAKLIAAAFEDMRPVVDFIERERGGNNYSALVLPILKEKYGDIIYLVGGDSLQHLSTWYKPEEVLKICPIAVCGREGYEDVKETAQRAQSEYGGRIIPLEYMGRDVSSSMLRARLLLGEEPDTLPKAVLDIIENEGLFEQYFPMIEKLREYQTDELFEHSKAVVKRAVDFNSKHDLKQPFEKVFLAALLHDNAKQRPALDGLSVPKDAVGTPVLHQFLGAEKARRDFGVTDDDILDAIRYHTTAKADMTGLEKLIYTADSLSDDRMYAPIPELRRLAIEDFEAGFKATLKFTYDKLLSRGKGIYPLTVEAYEYYIIQGKK